MIVKAAVRKGDLILSGGLRHIDIVELMKENGIGLTGTICGFLNEGGDFLDRRDAALAVIKEGQTHLYTKESPNLKPGDQLQSQDLW